MRFMSKQLLLAALAVFAISATANAQYYEVPPTEFTGPLTNPRYEDGFLPIGACLNFTSQDTAASKNAQSSRMPYADGNKPELKVADPGPRMPYAEEDETTLWKHWFDRSDEQVLGFSEPCWDGVIAAEWIPRAKIDIETLAARLT